MILHHLFNKISIKTQFLLTQKSGLKKANKTKIALRTLLFSSDDVIACLEK